MASRRIRSGPGPIPLFLCAAVAISGCGGGGSSTESAAPTPQRSKPKVEVPKGPPPKKLVIKNLIKGTGPSAGVGSEVTVQYVGVDYATGKQFDASWDRGQPFSFLLGAGKVIPGWDRGVAGMRVGGRRELIVPPNLGYGAKGQPPKIAPNSTLVFVIDLLDSR